MRNLALLLLVVTVFGCMHEGAAPEDGDDVVEEVASIEQDITVKKTYTRRNVNDGTFNVPDWADQQVAWCNAMRNDTRNYWCTYMGNWQGTWCADRSTSGTKVNFFSELVSWEDNNGQFHDQVYIFRLNGPLSYSTTWVYEGVVLGDNDPYKFDYNGAVWDVIGNNTGECFVDNWGNITMTTKQVWF